MHTDRLLCDAHPADPLDFIGIFAQKSIGVLLGIFGNALAFALMNFPRIATASRRPRWSLERLRNRFTVLRET